MAKVFSFENGMNELEELVSALEAGDMPLDDTFKAYEKAVKLALKLKGILGEGEKKIQLLSEELTRTDISDEVDEQ